MGVGFFKTACVVATCGALGLAACGGDDSKTAASTAPAATTGAAPAAGASTTAAAGTAGSAGSTPAAGGGATNKPFKVMVAGDFTSTIAYTVPEIAPAVKGVLKAYPNITVETCDTKGDQNQATVCERKAIDDKVVAFINGFDALGQDSSILDKAGIPVLGFVNEKVPNAFALASSAGGYVGMGVALGKSGCKKLGVLELNGTGFLADAIVKGFKSTGGAEVGRSEIASNAPDLAPAIAKLMGANSECIALSVIPPQLIQAATAVNQTGKKPLLGGTASIFFPQIIKAMGPLAEGVIMTDSVGSPAETTPGNTQIKADMAAIDPKAPLTAMAMYGWISGKMIIAAMPNIQGDVTPASMLAALNGIKDLDVMGVAHPITVSELKDPALKRFINHYTATFTIKNGVPTRTSDFVDIAPVIDG